MIVYLGAKTLPEDMIRAMNTKHDADLLAELKDKVLNQANGNRYRVRLPFLHTCLVAEEDDKNNHECC